METANSNPTVRIDRRKLLAVLGGASVALPVCQQEIEAADGLVCVPTTPQVTEGPYWVDEKLFRADIRTDPTTGVARAGVPLTLTITVQNTSGSTCTPMVGAWVDIWHCDAIGIYSDEGTYNPGGGTGSVNTTGQKFLRGYQVTDANGQVTFQTIYPGWYTSRTIHIHARVRTFNGSAVVDNYVTQFFFDETITNKVMAIAPYSNRTTARDTTNATDNVLRGASSTDRMMLALTENSGTYASSITLGFAFKATSASTAPSIGTGGVVNGASGAAGVTPGSWTTIFGSNLATTTQALGASDLVSNALPASLGGTSVQINGKTAYPIYVSPSQVNVLTPEDTTRGNVVVGVTNSAGSTSSSSTLVNTLPGLFVASGYVRAVRPSDSAIINGTGIAEGTYTISASAKPGDVLELFGTGLGTSTYAGAANAVFTGAYPTTNAVTVTIGGKSATVTWAGVVGPGLYQINLLVPADLASGNHAVVVTVAGTSSPSSGALLKVASA